MIDLRQSCLHSTKKKKSIFGCRNFASKLPFVAKDIAEALLAKKVEQKNSKWATAGIVSAIGDKLLRATQDCETAAEAWEKLQYRYSGKLIISKLAVLNNLLIMKLKGNDEMGDHLAQLDFQFSNHPAMGSKVEEQMKEAILLSSPSKPHEFTHTVASVHTIWEKTSKWSYATDIFIERSKRLRIQRTTRKNQD